MKRVSILLAALFALTLTVTFAAAPLYVIVEAEDFVKEEGGTVERLDGRTMASGKKSVRNWDFPGQLLEWEVEIPKGTGLFDKNKAYEYMVVIRFNSSEDVGIDMIREMKIDGQYPGEAFKKIEFYWTGGWSKGVNNWQNLVVVGADGKPALVMLKPGKHTVSLNNINGRVGLDSFGFLRPEIDPDVLGPAGPKVERPVPSPAPAPVPAPAASPAPSK